MKKNKFIYTFIISFIVCSCVSNRREPEQTKTIDNYKSAKIDTIIVHGNKHEMLYIRGGRCFNGFCHSPECWCLKDKVNEEY